MKKEIIIAKYDKDVSWLEELNQSIKISVYRKDGIEDKINDKSNVETFYLPNIGREIHTYFYHIYNNYDNLSDYNFFVQDYPFDHWEDLIEIVNDNQIITLTSRSALNMEEFYGFHFNTNTYPSERGGVMHDMYPTQHHGNGKIISCWSNGLPHDNTNVLNVDKYWDIFFDSPKPNFYEFIPGAHFCVTKNRIHLRPKEFYSKLINILENDFITPWIFERLMCYIFNPKYKVKI